MIDHSAFYATLAAWRSRPFDWHKANCGHFAADIGRCWGVDIEVPDFESIEDAEQWLRDRGVKSIYAYVRRQLGRRYPPLQAKRGWIVYRKGQGIEGSAIGTIDRKALFVGERGLIEVPLSQCEGAFDPEQYSG